MSIIINSAGQQYQNNADGYQLGGGLSTGVTRTMTFTGADMTFTGAGTNTYTFPASTDTLVGRNSTDTLSNKTLVAPVLGAATATSINGLIITTTTGTFTLTSAKTLAVTNTLTLSGTDSTIMTFPTTTATIARTDAAQTFTGTQTFSGFVLGTGGFETSSSVGNSNLFGVGGTSSSANTTTGLLFAGATQVRIRAGAYGNSSSTLATSDSTATFIIGSTPTTTAATGTNALIAGLVVKVLGTITSGGATLSNTATVYIEGASTAATGGGVATNYALWVDGGATRLDGVASLGTTPVSTTWLSLGAATTSLSSLNITGGTAPTSPVDGDLWEATNHLYARLNGVTYQIDQQTGGAVGPEAAMTQTITWTGSTPPSGSTNHTYAWSQSGNAVSVRVNLKYSVAGTSLTACTFPFPSDLPLPLVPNSFSTGQYIYYEDGFLSAVLGTISPERGRSGILYNSPGSFSFTIINTTSGNMQYGWITATYLVA